jgi:hypothetical protein
MVPKSVPGRIEGVALSGCVRVSCRLARWASTGWRGETYREERSILSMSSSAEITMSGISRSRLSRADAAVERIGKDDRLRYICLADIAGQGDSHLFCLRFAKRAQKLHTPCAGHAVALCLALCWDHSTLLDGRQSAVRRKMGKGRGRLTR